MWILSKLPCLCSGKKQNGIIQYWVTSQLALYIYVTYLNWTIFILTRISKACNSLRSKASY